MEQTARKADVSLTFIVLVDATATQRQLVSADLSYSITTQMSVREEVNAGLLSANEITDPAMGMVLMLVRSNQRPTTLAICEIARLLSDRIRHLPDAHAWDTVPAYLPIDMSGNSKADPE